MDAARGTTATGLLLGAVGIAVLWASGVDFPFVVPPGLLVLGTGVLALAVVRRPWACLLGAFLGAFVVVGFLISPTGIDNLTGEAGAAVATGQAVQLTGVLLAVVSGVVAFRRERERVGPRRA